MHIESQAPLALSSIESNSFNHSESLKERFVEALTTGNSFEIAACIEEGVDVNQKITINPPLARKIAQEVHEMITYDLIFTTYESGNHPHFSRFPNRDSNHLEIAKVFYGENNLSGYNGQLRLPHEFRQELNDYYDGKVTIEELFQKDCDLLEGKFFLVHNVLLGKTIVPTWVLMAGEDLVGARILLENGADPFYKGCILGDTESYGPELDQDSAQIDLEFAELFHEFGLGLEEMMNGKTPSELMEAAKELGNKPLLQFLEKHGYHSEEVQTGIKV